MLCHSCLILSLPNISSFSCSNHKALTPNVINPMKPGQYSTGKGLIPTCLCLFVLKISKQYLSFNALIHCTRGRGQTAVYGTTVYSIIHCFLSIKGGQPNLTSEAEVSGRHITLSAFMAENSITNKLLILQTIQPSSPD